MNEKRHIGTFEKKRMIEMKNVIIDVDTGIDDALALILAIKSHKLNVLGVTTIAGNVPVESATRNTSKVLNLIGREDIEVYEGCSKPLERDIVFRGFIHGEDGIAGELSHMKVKSKNKLHAVDFMIKEINEKPGKITMIMLGPVTNLVAAIRKDPSIAEKIREVYIMGGAVRVEGNITPLAEFNFYVDPESSADIMKHNLDIKLISLDVTKYAILKEDDLKFIDRNSEYGKFVYNISKYYMDKSTRSGEKSCLLHDPLVVAAVIDESIIDYERCHVDAEYSSRLCDGKSIGYFNRGYQDNVNLARSIDADRFKKMFLNIIGK